MTFDSVSVAKLWGEIVREHMGVDLDVEDADMVVRMANYVLRGWERTEGREVDRKQLYVEHKERAQGAIVAAMELLRSVKRCEFDAVDTSGVLSQ